jgi:hypothetical protein
MDRHRSRSETNVQIQSSVNGTSQEIVDGYSGIFSQLRKTPKDIEEVASMREPLGLNMWDMWAPPVIRNDGL